MKLKNIFNGMGYAGRHGKLGDVIDTMGAELDNLTADSISHDERIELVEAAALNSAQALSLLTGAIGGDMRLVVEPETLTTSITEQNHTAKQTEEYLVSGVVATAGEIDVTVTATDFEKTIKVSLVAEDTADAIVTAMKTALEADTEIAALFTFNAAGHYIGVVKAEADINDDLLSLTAETDTAVFTETDEFSIVHVVGTGGHVYTRDVHVSLVDSADNIHTWFTGALQAAIADTSTDGTASIVDVDMIEGEANISVKLKGTWVAGETNTLTIAELDMLGYTITGGSSVETSE